jgi:GT2 family glycosyltransferase
MIYMQPTLDIILVNRNSGEMIKACLNSIDLSNKRHFILNSVYIVDDFSTDKSLSDLHYSNLPLIIDKNEKRSGYGASCNRGAAKTSGSMILFLNTDIQLSKDSIDIAVTQYKILRKSDIGIVGIQLFELDGEISRCTSRFPSAGDLIVETLYLHKLFPRIFKGMMQSEWDHKNSKEVDQVMGAFMLMDRKIFEQSGGYSRHFFVYMEDLDLSLRIKKLGYKSFYLTDTNALHLGGGTARKFWWESLFFLQRSRIQYTFLHFSKISGCIVALNSLVFSPLIRMLYHISKFDFEDIKSTCKATAYLWSWAFKSLMNGPGKNG